MRKMKDPFDRVSGSHSMNREDSEMKRLQKVIHELEGGQCSYFWMAPTSQTQARRWIRKRQT